MLKDVLLFGPLCEHKLKEEIPEIMHHGNGIHILTVFCCCFFYQRTHRDREMPDSGVVSGSELSEMEALLDQQSAESLRQMTLEMELWENDVAKLSVKDKQAMFKVIEAKTRAEKEVREKEEKERKEREKSASGARRLV